MSDSVRLSVLGCQELFRFRGYQQPLFGTVQHLSTRQVIQALLLLHWQTA